MIEVTGLKKSFGPKQVLRGVSASVEDGKVLSIIGGSGSGKSTFIKCVMRLHQPDAGSIKVHGRETIGYRSEVELADLRRQFGYLFQEGALFDSLSVAENVAFGLQYLTDIPQTRYRAVARDMLALVGLQNVEDLRPSELSGGMKKRVALARALAPGPKCMLYDEPTSGLDPIMSDIINDLILDLKRKTGVTSIVITHDMKSAFKISDTIVMLHEGNFLLTGKPDDFRASADPRVRQFVDGSANGPIKMKLRDLD
ncbi:MAG: ATP-binding cassette domain-containing protein [Elusimicrobia bacterium]|nr:ATP-binding cassette domain-containing protein [Elusimicrobiota bacterium]